MDIWVRLAFGAMVIACVLQATANGRLVAQVWSLKRRIAMLERGIKIYEAMEARKCTSAQNAPQRPTASSSV